MSMNTDAAPARPAGTLDAVPPRPAGALDVAPNQPTAPAQPEAPDRPTAEAASQRAMDWEESRAVDALLDAMPAADDAVCPAALDYLYNTVDKLYYEFARGCGLSTCAFWMLYDLYRARRPLPLQQLNEAWAFSKQTINSALKALEAKGLVAFSYLEGSRKSKSIALTDDGVRFAAHHMQPAIDAEARAFAQLEPEEGKTLLRLIKRYTQALSAEMDEVRGERDAYAERAAQGLACEQCECAQCTEGTERV